MLRSPRVRFLVAIMAALLVSLSSAAFADTGPIQLTIYKGQSGGNGTLDFNGKRYLLGVGGLSVDFTVGGAKATLSGRINHIHLASDIEGVYVAAGAGSAIVRGTGTIMLRNEKGAVLDLSGQQTGLTVNADLSGLAITLK